MTTNATFLRRVLAIDAIGCAVSGLVLLADAGLLAAPLGLPATLLETAGLGLLPFAAFLGWLATRAVPPAAGVWAVIALNALWVVESLVLATGMAGPQPTTLGAAVIVGQAIMGAVLAELEFVGLKRLQRPVAA